MVGLTSEGRKMAGDIARRRAARMARVVERIPEPDRPAVLAALDALVEASRGL